MDKYIPTKNVITSGMLGKATGDALGVPVEFKKRDQMKHYHVTTMQGGGTYNKPAGTWSDDTSMALAAMGAIVDAKGVNYDKIMQYFVLWYDKAFFTTDGDRFDCGNAVREAIDNAKNGMKSIECGVKGDKQSGNGSLMRIFPFAIYYADGLLKGEKESIKAIADASSLTHSQKLCKDTCVLYSTVIAYFAYLSDCGTLDKSKKIEQLSEAIKLGIKNVEIYDNELEQRLLFLEDLEAIKNLDENSIEELPSGGFVLDSIRAAIWCFINTESYSECVLKAVNLGKDTDTTAAIAGALAGIFYSESEIPNEWLTTLKKNDAIRTTCEEFACLLKGEDSYYGNELLDLWRPNRMVNNSSAKAGIFGAIKNLFS